MVSALKLVQVRIKVIVSSFLLTLTASAAIPTIRLQDVDPKVGTPGYNCRAAIQQGLATLAPTGGTLVLPAQTLFIDFPEVVQDQLTWKTLQRSWLVVVPPNVNVVGQTGTNGPTTVIQWNKDSVPVFIYSGSDHASIQNIHFVYTGHLGLVWPYGDVKLLQALGYPTTFTHMDMMGGAPDDIVAPVWLVDSNYTLTRNLVIESATHDNTHQIVQGLALNGVPDIARDGTGGTVANVTGNTVSNVVIHDTLFGLMVEGQSNLTLDNISGDRRGAFPLNSTHLAPSHLIYVNAAKQLAADNSPIGELPNTNLTINGVTESSNNYTQIQAGGTLALKGIIGGTISNVTSQYPQGVIQTLMGVQNLSFSNLTWTSHYDLCGNYPTNCMMPVIYSTADTPHFPATQNLSFSNVSLISTVTPITIQVFGANLKMNNISITTPPTWLPGQSQPYGVLGIKNAANATVTNYYYTPLLTNYDPLGGYNHPFTGYNPSSGSVQIHINWPATLAIPAPMDAVIYSKFQVHSSSNRTVTDLNGTVTVH